MGPARSIDDAEFGMSEHREHREALESSAPSSAAEKIAQLEYDNRLLLERCKELEALRSAIEEPKK